MVKKEVATREDAATLWRRHSPILDCVEHTGVAADASYYDGHVSVTSRLSDVVASAARSSGSNGVAVGACQLREPLRAGESFEVAIANVGMPVKGVPALATDVMGRPFVLEDGESGDTQTNCTHVVIGVAGISHPLSMHPGFGCGTRGKGLQGSVGFATSTGSIHCASAHSPLAVSIAADGDNGPGNTAMGPGGRHGGGRQVYKKALKVGDVITVSAERSPPSAVSTGQHNQLRIWFSVNGQIVAHHPPTELRSGESWMLPVHVVCWP